MSIAIEAAELMERFQWLTTEEAQEAVADPRERAAISDERANILIYCLSLSNALDLDISSAVLGKLHTNEHRYPAEEFRGASVGHSGRRKMIPNLAQEWLQSLPLTCQGFPGTI